MYLALPSWILVSSPAPAIPYPPVTYITTAICDLRFNNTTNQHEKKALRMVSKNKNQDVEIDFGGELSEASLVDSACRELSMYVA
ncbi:hypothetical protein BDZ91DRAFT_156735 [Kalaharituber pfeilii]|nr:hypothetical protein BDZ91DRAFT_156735 [Kalaharituber pfeilii]